MLKAETIVVLPAHNEEAAIGKVISGIQSALSCMVVVSASGCKDGTEDVARKYGAEVLPAPRGKGLAIQYAFKRIEADKVLMMDADATYPPEFISLMLGMLDRGYDAVYGERDLSIQSWLDRWGNSFITRQAELLYTKRIHDVCTGYWAFKGNVIKQLDIKSTGFNLEADLYTQIVKNHFTLGHISIPYHPRIGDKKINRWDHLRIMKFLWLRRFSYWFT